MIEPIEPHRRRQRRRTLTDLQVKNLPKKRKRHFVSDPEMGGHYIRVMPEGANVYCIVTRDPNGKQVWFTLGTADELKIEEARELARVAIKKIRAGKPPKETPPEKPDSFKAVCEGWLKRHVAAKKLRTEAEIRRCLHVYVYPRWSDRAFTGIRRRDIASLLDHIEDHHGARMADLVLGIVRSIASWYSVRNDDYLSPFVARGMKRHKTGARSRTLNDDELRRVWKQAEASGSFGALVRLLLLTAQRRAVVLGMRRDDLSPDGVWQIPTPERSKGNAGSVQLPKQALAIIEAQPTLKGNPFVLAASRGDGQLNGFSRGKKRFDQRCNVHGWTLHDLRRSARTLMSRAGVDRDIAERVLGHSVGTAIEAVYDHHKYDLEKKTALAKLANLIDEIVSGEPSGKVVKMKPKARADA